MLNKARRSLAQRVNKIPAELVAKTRISPNIVTALGLLVALVTAWVLFNVRQAFRGSSVPGLISLLRESRLLSGGSAGWCCAGGLDDD